ncbi:helix-turn-helix transcriptional regulator [Thalassospira sp.]|uniref:helix-turn-helix domain-containing protein n=1 Tax=Thalassospira sp. TaxID=1912094 RepID=UPI000C66702B|nr:helix-turn-helix transcriptional regulator [Thalassospira sp.]MBC05692.1 hypothetical protein [Thalassospira sp.]|tara:strand:+ start:8381 stop:8653 length:273 start_codon:yes stop_codon:yes gene_type:complete
MNIDDNLKRIRAWRLKVGGSLLAFAEKVQVNEATLRKLSDENWNPTVSTIRKCEAVIPPEFMANANDDIDPSSEPQAAPSDRGEDHTQAA